MNMGILGSLVLSTMLIGVPPVIAAESVPSSPERATASQVRAFQQVKLSMRDAVAAAERQPGGEAVDIGFAIDQGQGIYRVKTYQNGTVWEGTLDASTGKMIGSGTSMAETQLDPEDRAEIAGLKAAKTNLSSAIESAERQAGGKAIDAGLEQRNDAIVYEIKVVKDNSIVSMTVDPASGKVTQGAAEAVLR